MLTLGKHGTVQNIQSLLDESLFAASHSEKAMCNRSESASTVYQGQAAHLVAMVLLRADFPVLRTQEGHNK